AKSCICRSSWLSLLAGLSWLDRNGGDLWKVRHWEVARLAADGGSRVPYCPCLPLPASTRPFRRLPGCPSPPFLRGPLPGVAGLAQDSGVSFVQPVRSTPSLAVVEVEGQHVAGLHDRVLGVGFFFGGHGRGKKEPTPSIAPDTDYRLRG